MKGHMNTGGLLTPTKLPPPPSLLSTYQRNPSGLYSLFIVYLNIEKYHYTVHDGFRPCGCDWNASCAANDSVWGLDAWIDISVRSLCARTPSSCAQLLQGSVLFVLVVEPCRVYVEYEGTDVDNKAWCYSYLLSTVSYMSLYTSEFDVLRTTWVKTERHVKVWGVYVVTQLLSGLKG